MAEINITAFISEYQNDMTQFSDSIANSGLQNIGKITWRNALELVTDEPELVKADRADLIAHFYDFGAWTRNELNAMPDSELTAMLVQEIAAEYQERERASERGRLEQWEADFGGRLIAEDSGDWFFYIGM